MDNRAFTKVKSRYFRIIQSRASSSQVRRALIPTLDVAVARCKRTCLSLIYTFSATQLALRNVLISKHVYRLLIALDSFLVIYVVVSVDHCVACEQVGSLLVTHRVIRDSPDQGLLLRIIPRVKL
jgi:hypothetical protein